MANADDWKGLLLAGGLAAAGLWGLSALERNKLRQEFVHDLEEELLSAGLELVSAEVASLPNGLKAWEVTLQHPVQGLLSFSVELDAEEDPYSPVTCHEVASRLLTYFG